MSHQGGGKHEQSNDAMWLALPEKETPMSVTSKAAAMLREHICYVERALEVLGGKWTLLLVHEMMGGVKRYSELRRAIPEASAKMLTMRLRDLEMANIVERQVFAETPPHVEYRLTPKGYALQEAIEALRIWGATFYEAELPHPTPPAAEEAWDGHDE